MRINGWQRLFVIATIIWLFYSSFLAVQGFENRKLAGEVSILMGMIQSETSPDKQSDFTQKLGSVPMSRFKDLLDVMVVATNAELVPPRRIEELAKLAHAEYANSRERKDDILDMIKLLALLGLLVPALFYGVGLVVRWVVRGF